MPRKIEFVLPPQIAQALCERIDGIDGIVSVSHERGVSLRPAGDRLSVLACNGSVRPVLDAAADLDVLRHGSIATFECKSLIATAEHKLLDRESNETSWDEMAFLLRKECNLDGNLLGLMFLAGLVSAGGLWSDSIPVIVGSMVIAPAFTPMMRIPFGVAMGSPQLARAGVVTMLAGYAAMFAGALAAGWILQALMPTPALAEQRWVQYWTSYSTGGMLTSAAAALAGALVICSLRAVLSTGVMIALALVPAMAMVGLGLSVGEGGLALAGLGRWAGDVALVIAAGAVVAGGKRLLVHRGRALG